MQAFHFVSRDRKKFQTVKLGASSCVLHAGNVISSRYPPCHEFCRRFTTIPCICACIPFLYFRVFHRGNIRASVYEETRASSIYIRALVHDFVHTYNVFRAAFGSELFESFIRRDSLLTRRETQRRRSAMECWSSYYGAFSIPVSTRLIRKMGNGSDRVHECWEKIWIFSMRHKHVLMSRKFATINDDECVKLVCRYLLDAVITRR